MRIGRLIGGIVCLIAAVVLAIADAALPADKVVFMVGDTNMPIVAVIGLAVLGLGLLVTSLRR